MFLFYVNCRNSMCKSQSVCDKIKVRLQRMMSSRMGRILFGHLKKKVDITHRNDIYNRIRVILSNVVLVAALISSGYEI